jgi:hypothetical protein
MKFAKLFAPQPIEGYELEKINENWRCGAGKPARSCLVRHLHGARNLHWLMGFQPIKAPYAISQIDPSGNLIMDVGQSMDTVLSMRLALLIVCIGVTVEGVYMPRRYPSNPGHHQAQQPQRQNITF